FDLFLSNSGDDFAVMGMHFKLGLYEHQSAGALQAMLTLLTAHPELIADPNGKNIDKIVIVAYEPAFGIIGDPAKRNPTTRQSADHSMLYIVATLLRKAIEKKAVGWEALMLEPDDYGPAAIKNAFTRELMDKITFQHGGPEYDAKYPDGIPTSVIITARGGTEHDSGLVMYPGGHARNASAPHPVNLKAVLAHKFQLLGALAFDNPQPIIDRYSNLEKKSAQDIQTIHDYELTIKGKFD
ncbi:MAG: hypothetical protein RBS39_11155, partial [Phycisphaerales bacterium]|nr:hypothetical protein [Phycisphaerales bacterium]